MKDIISGESLRRRLIEAVFGRYERLCAALDEFVASGKSSVRIEWMQRELRALEDVMIEIITNLEGVVFDAAMTTPTSEITPIERRAFAKSELVQVSPKVEVTGLGT